MRTLADEPLIKLQSTDDLHFIADPHFGHRRTLDVDHCNRPFKHVDEMDETLVQRWNECVQPSHHVYTIGDLCWYPRSKAEAFIWRLNGTIHLIRGNHDRKKNTPRNVEGKLIHEGAYLELQVPDKDIRGGNQLIVLCHYAFEVWNKKHWGSLHLYGHSHGNLKSKIANRMDVGVDCNNFTPLSYQDVKALVPKHAHKPIDHHG